MTAKDVRAIGQCATITVPENRARPAGRTLTLPIIRIPAQVAARSEPVFVLNGGPGASNMPGGLALKQLHNERDVYFIGYRGADGSTVLRCPEVASALVSQSLGTAESTVSLGEATRACAGRLTASGVDLSHYTIFDVINDLEDVAKGLGLRKVSLVSVSYGTRVAQFYTRRHPKRIARSVMFGANPPGHFVFGAEVTDRVIDRLAQICTSDPVCSGYSKDLRKTIRLALTTGQRTGNPRINDETTRLAMFSMLYGRETTLLFLRGAVAAEMGDTALLEQAEAFLQSGFSDVIVGDLLAKGGIDVCRYAALRPTFAMSDSSVGSPWDQFYAALAAGWPVSAAPKAYLRAASDPTPTLVVNGDLDVATPLTFIERELMPFLPNGQLVVLKDYGHGDFIRQEGAIGRLTSEFLNEGKVDRSLIAADPYVFPKP